MADRFLPRWTDAARKAAFYAQEEAARNGTNDVAPEHFLLALLRDPLPPVSSVLMAFGVDPVGLSQEINARLPAGPGLTARDMQLTSPTKQAVNMCYEEAARLGNDWIGAEHLLLGLARGDGDLAAEILTAHGVTGEACRAQIVALQQAS